MNDDYNDDDLTPHNDSIPHSLMPQTGVRVEEFKPMQWDSSQLQPDDWKGTPFEGARNRDGSLATEITNDTLVTFSGVQMPASRAADLGFLSVGDDGRLVIITPEEREANRQARTAERQSIEQAELEKELPRLETVDRDAANAADNVSSIAAEAGIPLAAIVSEFLVNERVNSNFFRAALASGVNDPKAALEAVAEGAAKQGVAVLAANGVVDVADCLNWAEKAVSKMDKVRADLRLLKGDPTGYRHIADRYRQFAPVNSERSGVETFVKGGREFVRFANGDVMSTTAARSKGRI